MQITINTVEELRDFVEAIRPQIPATILTSTPLEQPEEWSHDEEPIEMLQNLYDLIPSLYESINKLKEEMKIQRGALEETINQLRELQRAEGKAERPAQKLVIRGVYCRFCGKMLNGTTQKIFCSQACAGRWTGQHKGERATPRLTLKDEKLGTTVVAGEGVRD